MHPLFVFEVFLFYLCGSVAVAMYAVTLESVAVCSIVLYATLAAVTEIETGKIMPL